MAVLGCRSHVLVIITIIITFIQHTPNINSSSKCHFILYKMQQTISSELCSSFNYTYILLGKIQIKLHVQFMPLVQG